MNTNTLLLLSLVVCATSAMSIMGGTTRCLCQSFRDDLPRRPVKRLEILPPSNSCDQMEIILHLRSGTRFCLNPEAEKIIEVLKKLRSKRAASQKP
ncbi:growth-regulated alpha protein-like isoform X1 [Conger conger]|uniref:growth-regulated alpha protein-like isoform X1 n=2 Tax=Conger conger TaxID=82655 RepID=UPI002A5A2EC0|nr:growth-regulated alpha protein-like isoform X1 [Conger conger]